MELPVQYLCCQATITLHHSIISWIRRSRKKKLRCKKEQITCGNGRENQSTGGPENNYSLFRHDGTLDDYQTGIFYSQVLLERGSIRMVLSTFIVAAIAVGVLAYMELGTMIPVSRGDKEYLKICVSVSTANGLVPFTEHALAHQFFVYAFCGFR
jgi:hypothetical protein